MAEESLSEKQDFLSKQIIDAEYDPEEFQDFMRENSEKQLNLEEWTLKELKIIVARFKRQSYIGSEGKEEPNEVEEKMVQNIKEEQQKNYGDIDEISVSPSVNSSLYRHFTFIKKSQLPNIYNEVHAKQRKIQVMVRNYTKSVPNNIFQSSYILYDVKCSNGWHVKRRFTDFAWLSKSLQKSYSGFPIPPIPQKTTIRSFDDKHLEKRMMIFQKFLETLIYIPEICSDMIVENFLKIDNDEQFLAFKKMHESKIDKMTKKDEIHSILGEESIIIEESSVQSSKIKFYSSLSQKYDKLNYQFSHLSDSFHKIAEEIYEISDTLGDITNQMSKHRNWQIFSVLNQFTNQLAEHSEIIGDFIKVKLGSVWQYENLHCRTFLKSMQKIKKDQNYVVSKQKSMVKIADELDQSFTNSLEPNKPLKQYQILKEKYRTKLSYIIREVKRYEEKELEKVSEDWKSSLRQLSEKVSRLMIGIADQLTKTISLCEGKKLMEVEYINKK